MLRTGLFLTSIIGISAVGGCGGHTKQAASTCSMYQTPLIVLPATEIDELTIASSDPSALQLGWLASRNARILGGAPPMKRVNVLAEQEMRDIQRITSGRPYDTLRYTVRTRTLLP